MATDHEQGPPWLAESCPPWCERIHEDGDHPEDRFHQGTAISLPAILRRSLLPEHGPEATELLVMPVAAMADRSPWIVVRESEGRAGLILDRASARALRDALARVLDRLGPANDPT